jgi:EAL domain-containing protein (putative c-di-GMP-specific phosphodiesterase class I)
MAIVDRVARSASVRAVDDCVVLPITAAQLERRMAVADPIVRMVLNVVLNRFRATLSNMGGGTGSVGSPFFHHDSALVDAAAAELRMERDIDEALSRSEIEPHYQPIIRLSDGKLTGLEALARWRHPTRGLIPPAVFVPVMEASGRSADLTVACMRQITRDLPELLTAALANVANVDELHVNLNLSGHDLGDADLIRRLADMADESGVATRAITLELTETGLARTPDMAGSALRLARERGFGIAIDDFGTGYSTMASIRNTPAQTLKVDRSFIEGIGDSGVNTSIVRNIVQLAQSLGMTVVAEGIETAPDERMVRDLGCDFGQGFFFARPQPRDACVEFIRTWKRRGVGTAGSGAPVSGAATAA